MADKIAICRVSSNGKIREFPSKKLASMVPAKQVRMLETQEDIGCEYAKDTEPVTTNNKVSDYLNNV